MSGGASQLPHLVKSLERRLEVPVEHVDPFKNITIDEDKFDMDLLRRMSSVASVAVGLGLRRQRDK